MEVHLKPELQARVDRAARNNSGPAEDVQQLSRTLLGPCCMVPGGSKERVGPTRPRRVPDPRKDGRSNRADVPFLNAGSLVAYRRRGPITYI